MRYLIVDDYLPFLDAASGLLEDQGAGVVGVATSGAEALRRAEELQPEVILEASLPRASQKLVTSPPRSSGSVSPKPMSPPQTPISACCQLASVITRQ